MSEDWIPQCGRGEILQDTEEVQEVTLRAGLRVSATQWGARMKGGGCGSLGEGKVGQLG
jgi:hypothetical protein